VLCFSETAIELFQFWIWYTPIESGFWEWFIFDLKIWAKDQLTVKELSKINHSQNPDSIGVYQIQN
jgi:hypothetical protein